MVDTHLILEGYDPNHEIKKKNQFDVFQLFYRLYS
jgi:hypothetical protein